MKRKLMSATLLLATLAGAATANEITDRKTLTLDGARRAIARASGRLRQHALLDDNGDGVSGLAPLRC